MDFKTIGRVGIALFVFAMLFLVIGQFATVETGISAQRQAITELGAAQVVQVSVTALNNDGTPASTAFIRDSNTITQLVKAYQTMPRQVAGNGRLGSGREVNVTFEFADGRKLDSFVSHNERNNLVFIRTKDRPDFQGPDDFFASKDITPILFSQPD